MVRTIRSTSFKTKLEESNETKTNNFVLNEVEQELGVTMELRPYQQSAVNAVYQYLSENPGNPCVVIPTGGGKTPVLASICRDCVRWGGRVLVLAHVKELLQQSADKLHTICPDVPVGIYSAGLKSRDTSEPVIVAGIQSVYNRACELDRFDLIIVDECHLIPPEGEGRYRQLLKTELLINPKVRLVGLTATPYRMRTGMVCGEDNLLNDICFDVGVKDLIAQGYLSPLRTKVSANKIDFDSLHVRGGEYVAEEVDHLMNREDNVASACREILKKAEGRNSVLLFASSVDHARNIKAMIEKISSQECGLVTGKTPAVEREGILNRFTGKCKSVNLFGDLEEPLRFLVNVNVLTTGFDAPNVDCIGLLRPTASPGLYYQMVGRGFRIAPGKSDCLVLDFGGNIFRHGPVDAIEVKTRNQGHGAAPQKDCPDCGLVVFAGCRTCPECGFEFPEPEKSSIESHSDESGILSGEITDTDYDVQAVRYYEHTKKDDPDAPHTMRVEYQISPWRYKSEWVCPEHEGFALGKFHRWWSERTDEPIPVSADEAVTVASSGALAETKQITVRQVSGKRFDTIIRYVLGEKPKPEERKTCNNNCWDCAHQYDGFCQYKKSEIVSGGCEAFLCTSDIPF